MNFGGEARGFLSENQEISRLEIGLIKRSGGKLGKKPEPALRVYRGAKLAIGFVLNQIHMLPVIQAGPPHGLFGDVKAQGLYQVQPGARGDAQAAYIARVRRNLRFN